MFADCEGGLEGLLDFLGDGPGVRFAADVGQEGDELVAAVAGQGVAAAQTLLEPERDGG